MMNLIPPVDHVYIDGYIAMIASQTLLKCFSSATRVILPCGGLIDFADPNELATVDVACAEKGDPLLPQEVLLAFCTD